MQQGCAVNPALIKRILGSIGTGVDSFGDFKGSEGPISGHMLSLHMASLSSSSLLPVYESVNIFPVFVSIAAIFYEGTDLSPHLDLIPV